MSEDLIKRNSVIATIGRMYEVCTTRDITDYRDLMLEAVKVLPSADRPQEWIPCSERLPEEREWIGTEKFGTTISDKVLVTFESRGERFVKPMHFQNGELGGMDKHTMDAVHGEWKAVAWMPLPEPWRGADDD